MIHSSTHERQFLIPAAWTSSSVTPPGHVMPASHASSSHVMPASHASSSHVMTKVEALEQAKHCASASFRRLASGDDVAHEATADEQRVLHARVDVLNTLLAQGKDQPPLCLPASGSAPRVCVSYDRLRCDGEMELGPMQSTMAWAVQGAEEPFLKLMSAPHQAEHAAGLRELLELVRASAPRKDILQGLQATLALPPPERLVLKRLSASVHDAHSRVCEGLSEAANKKGPPSLYRVAWCALDLNVLEGWQNPSTNAAIRLSILDAAHRLQQGVWTNAAHLQVRIFRGEECHALTLRPFWDSESCTVSHLQFRQSVFDVCGPERGILNLARDPSSIAPIPQGAFLPLQGYVCLGAHRKSRLNEAQLNYVHAQGLLAHGFDVRLLPDPAALLSAPGMAPAKATRVSADRLDVLASSYRVADQVYTSISVVQYPPFGTQFSRQKPAVAGELSKGKNSLAAGGLDPNAPEFGSQSEQAIHWEPTPQVGTGRRRAFEPKEEGQEQNLLYLQERTPQPPGKPGKTKRWFTGDLEEGQYFFVDGVLGDSYSLSDRIILFDMDPNLPRYREFEAHAKRISRSLRRTHGGVWDPERSFYDNIEDNMAVVTMPSGEESSINEEWSRQWTEVIKNEIHQQLRDSQRAPPAGPGANPFEASLNFFYCPTGEKWAEILEGTNLVQDYQEFSARRVQALKRSGHLPAALQKQLAVMSRATLQTQLPLPRTRLSARTDDPAVSRLQSRVAALETRLERAQQDENTQFLLKQVLERLEDENVV